MKTSNWSEAINSWLISQKPLKTTVFELLSDNMGDLAKRAVTQTVKKKHLRETSQSECLPKRRTKFGAQNRLNEEVLANTKDAKGRLWGFFLTWFQRLIL